MLTSAGGAPRQRWVMPAEAPGASWGPVTGTSPRASSIAARVSALSSMPAAAALACTCSGCEAPTMAEAGSGRRSTHASAPPPPRPRPPRHREPGALGDGHETLHGLERAVGELLADEAVHLVARRPRV